MEYSKSYCLICQAGRHSFENFKHVVFYIDMSYSWISIQNFVYLLSSKMNVVVSPLTPQCKTGHFKWVTRVFGNTVLCARILTDEVFASYYIAESRFWQNQERTDMCLVILLCYVHSSLAHSQFGVGFL